MEKVINTETFPILRTVDAEGKVDMKELVKFLRFPADDLIKVRDDVNINPTLVLPSYHMGEVVPTENVCAYIDLKAGQGTTQAGLNIFAPSLLSEFYILDFPGGELSQIYIMGVTVVSAHTNTKGYMNEDFSSVLSEDVRNACRQFAEQNGRSFNEEYFFQLTLSLIEQFIWTERWHVPVRRIRTDESLTINKDSYVLDTDKPLFTFGSPQLS